MLLPLHLKMSFFSDAIETKDSLEGSFSKQPSKKYGNMIIPHYILIPHF